MVLQTPSFAQNAVQTVAELGRKFDLAAVAIERDGFANVIDHHLARAAARHMLFKSLTDAGVDRPIDVFVQNLEELFALHTRFVL